MSPEEAASIRSRIVFWIEELERCLCVDGAMMSMSRWRRSHQKGVVLVLSMVEQLVVETTMACLIDA